MICSWSLSGQKFDRTGDGSRSLGLEDDLCPMGFPGCSVGWPRTKVPRPAGGRGSGIKREMPEGGGFLLRGLDLIGWRVLGSEAESVKNFGTE